MRSWKTDKLLQVWTCLLIVISSVTTDAARVSRKRHRQDGLATQQKMYMNQAHMQFTLDVLSTLLIDNFSPQTRHVESFAFSPLSVQSTLMMVQLGAKGATHSEITNALYLGQLDNGNATFSTAHELYGQAVKSLVEDTNVKPALAIANQIFVQKDLIPTSTYELGLRHYHMARLRPIDFGSLDTPPNINEWVEKETKGMIKNFIVASPSPATLLMAVNALYYKGDWQFKFNPLDTEREARFQLLNGKTTSVPMMVGKLPIGFAYSDALNTTIIELPYKVPRLGLFLLLPDQVTGIFALMRSLNSSSFTALIASMRKQGKEGVNVRLPKFEVNSTPRMTNILRNNLGVRALFSSGEADLSGMFLNSPGVAHVDDFLHKVVFKIDEKGTVGAAATATVVERVGSFSGSYFEADHPFMYFLTDKQTGLILFAGIYAGPSSLRS